MRSTHKQRPTAAALTLIEMIVALSVFLVLMTFLMGLVNAVGRINSAQRGQSELYEQQRLLFDILDRDISSMVASDTPGSEIAWKFLGNSCVFVTASGIGVQNNDSSVMAEVGYAVNATDSTLVRYHTFCRYNPNPNPNWDFLGDSTLDAASGLPKWAKTWGEGTDSVTVVVGSVDTFIVHAYRDWNVEATAAEDTFHVPAYVTVEVHMFDPRMKGNTWSATDVDKTKKVFRKLIQLKREF